MRKLHVISKRATQQTSFRLAPLSGYQPIRDRLGIGPVAELSTDDDTDMVRFRCQKIADAVFS